MVLSIKKKKKLLHACLAVLKLCQIYYKFKNKRRFWVREIYTDRDECGFYEKTFKVIKERDPEQFFKAVRITVPMFDKLLHLIRTSLTKTSIRKPLSPEFRLAMTLIYLAHGPSRQILAWKFKVGVSTVAAVLLETCVLLWKELGALYLAVPNTERWSNIADGFLRKTGMPNCVGALDGKHINIVCPPNSGTQYYNYKGRFSIVLMAICDTNYAFTAVDVGAFGSQSDGGVFAESSFGKQILNNTLPLPASKCLPNTEVVFPHFFVADAAFPLRRNIMRPFPGRNITRQQDFFNRRLSKSRMHIENAFGILSARWRVLLSNINCIPENADKIVKATLVLHNYLISNDPKYCPPDFPDSDAVGDINTGRWRESINPLQSFASAHGGHNASRDAFRLRNQLSDYINQTFNQSE